MEIKERTLDWIGCLGPVLCLGLVSFEALGNGNWWPLMVTIVLIGLLAMVKSLRGLCDIAFSIGALSAMATATLQLDLVHIAVVIAVAIMAGYHLALQVRLYGILYRTVFVVLSIVGLYLQLRVPITLEYFGVAIYFAYAVYSSYLTYKPSPSDFRLKIKV